jgi:hypothetical protein
MKMLSKIYLFCLVFSLLLNEIASDSNELLKINPFLFSSWSSDSLNEKIKKYLLLYCLYFILIYAILLLFDFSNIFEKISVRYHELSYQSTIYKIPKGYFQFTFNNINILPGYISNLLKLKQDIIKKDPNNNNNSNISNNFVINNERDFSNNNNNINNNNNNNNNMKGNNDSFISLKLLEMESNNHNDDVLRITMGNSYEEQLKEYYYPYSFYTFLLSKYCYIGGDSILENFWLYLFNNHNLLSCFLSPKRSYLTRYHRRLILILNFSFIFCLTSITNAGLNVIINDSSNGNTFFYLSLFFNLLIIRYGSLVIYILYNS